MFGMFFKAAAAPIVTEIPLVLHEANSLLHHVNGAAHSFDDIANITMGAAQRAIPVADHLASTMNETERIVRRVEQLMRQPTLTLSMS